LPQLAPRVHERIYRGKRFIPDTADFRSNLTMILKIFFNIVIFFLVLILLILLFFLLLFFFLYFFRLLGLVPTLIVVYVPLHLIDLAVLANISLRVSLV
jgi:hypothetical protein